MKGSRILLVDDEVVFTTNMSKLLTNRGYRVTAVNSGDSAVRFLQEQSVDVVVLDLKMPGMDGIATLKEIKKLGLFTPDPDADRSWFDRLGAGGDQAGRV